MAVARRLVRMKRMGVHCAERLYPSPKNSGVVLSYISYGGFRNRLAGVDRAVGLATKELVGKGQCFGVVCGALSGVMEFFVCNLGGAVLAAGQLWVASDVTRSNGLRRVRSESACEKTLERLISRTYD